MKKVHVTSLTLNLSKPQQLSTYALTLFQYKTLVDGIDVRVGKCQCVSVFNVYAITAKPYGHILFLVFLRLLFTNCFLTLSEYPSWCILIGLKKVVS